MTEIYFRGIGNNKKEKPIIIQANTYYPALFGL